ncbi:hypothetical protein [Tropicimonas sp. S265A]|uniref:hypothetical protein n=1 Tax=Tropicimonas sp. S265A TaxID=3415134 RepID=UPI003C7B7BCF
MAPKSLANFVGTHLLPFTNPRVVCPPGKLRATGRPNLIVATPMRSGTHVLIDLILNNMPGYRNRPLYVDLDQCVKQSTTDRDLLAQVTPDAGHVIKTHMPLSVPDSMASDPAITDLLAQGLVITVRRDRGDVCRSLARWHGIALEEAEAEYGPQYDRFWEFWTGRPQIALSFKDLFAPEKMRQTLADLAAASGTTPAKRYNPPPANTTKNRIYANKMMTRLAGRHAPRVDTTIHTLKF